MTTTPNTRTLGDSIPRDADLTDAGSALLALAAQQAVLPRQLQDGGVYAALVDGNVELLETPGYRRRFDEAGSDRPSRIERAVTIRDADSLLNYLAANTDADDPSEVGLGYVHGVGDLELWADVDQSTIIAVIDGGYGWRLHTATLKLRHSSEWDEWTRIDGELLPQVEFAQFVEDHISSIGKPDGGELLDVCQTLQAATKVDFKSSVILANGQRQFKYEEAVEAKAGQKGQLTIPGELTLVLRPYQGSEPVAITARFRYRLDDGQLRLGVRLAEPANALEAAFGQIVEEVQSAVPVRVNHGIG